MTSSSTLGTVVSSSSSGRSLLSRLKSPLQSKTRHFADFYILPDDPHRQYAPGDIISGSVILKVLKPVRITHLVISLHGYAQVFKNPNSPGDGYRNYSTTVGSGRGKKGGSYFGNGFISLFEDEVVLCGEGRLAEGVYHFNFELEFPSKGLPSSIDFERGTISYMLTATLTRPTTMSPTTTCDTKVYLQDSIDIASVAIPKRRIISLEPISRRKGTKTSACKQSLRRTVSASLHSVAEIAESARSLRAPASSTGVEENDVPGSPAPSDVSFESQLSSGNASGTEYVARSLSTAVGDHAQNGVWSNTQDKTIMATIDVLKGGFLRGDQIPIRVSVKHTKHVRSLRGIIVTLYRQARVDMHPALPVLPNSKGDKMKTEDYYPKSKTGLGGLSLSSAGSSHLFRKDLAQSFAPLFVDPRTLTADIKCSVRIPEEAFPTIANVPGAMISFKYFVEVLVDIQGKLSKLDRVLPNSGLVNVPTAFGPNTSMSIADQWSGTFVDTEPLRRERGVISCGFDVVIGTKDSERIGKRKEPSNEPVFTEEVTEFPPDSGDGAYHYTDPSDHSHHEEQYNVHHDGYYYDHYAYDGDAYYGPHDSTPAYYEAHSPGPPHTSVPDVEQTTELSEKERLRRAEERLLPSQPPGMEDSGAGPSTAPVLAPSAPILPEDDTQYSSYSNATPGPSHHPPPFHLAPLSGNNALTPPPGPSREAQDDLHAAETGSSSTIQGPMPNRTTAQGSSVNGEAVPSPSSARPEPAPEYTSPPAHLEPTDDKQELQRRHLEMATSAPPVDEGDKPAAGPSSPSDCTVERVAIRPSAPVLEEDDEGLVGPINPSGSAGPGGHARKPSETLPVYER